MYLQNINKSTNDVLTVHNPKMFTIKKKTRWFARPKNEVKLAIFFFILKTIIFWPSKEKVLAALTAVSACFWMMTPMLMNSTSQLYLLSKFKALNLYHHT